MNTRSVIEFKENHSTITASIIIALVIVLAYSPIIFLDQSYNHTTPIPPEFLGYKEKSTIFGNTGDVWANTSAIPPVIKLATTIFMSGQIPLWNPYVGVGQPLAADSTYHVFSPFNLGFLLPTQFWDLPLLIILWVAGTTTFLFLRSIGLNFTGSLAGGIFYMLSGGFSWFLPNPNPFVMTFTPLILYSLEKIAQNRNPKYVVLASISCSLAILGNHLESLILQFTLVGLYFVYRIVYPVISFYFKSKTSNDDKIDIKLNAKDLRRALWWSIIALIGGLGLSAFLILPTYEFLNHNHLEHGTDSGIQYGNPIGASSIFIPYILGELHAYWTEDVAGIGLFGYVGISALYFTILGIFLLSRETKENVHKYTPLFFLALSIFFIMKVYGVPIANWIGFLPVYNLLTFGNYLGVIIPFGFAVAAGKGIHSLRNMESKKIPILALIFSFSILMLLLTTILPHLLSSNAHFPPYVTPHDAQNYVIFQITQASLFLIVIFLFTIRVSKNKSIIPIVIPLILLELSLYIPLGLHPIWHAYKSIVVLLSMAVIVILLLKPNRIAWNLRESRVKLSVIISVLLIAFIFQNLVSYYSPFGMMEKYDSFQPDPVTNFLKENLQNQRMFSFEYTLGPNYPAAYELSTLGQFVAFNTNSFYSFIHNFLDHQADAGRLGFSPWTYAYGPMESMNKFFENKKYFDLLGVKYIITESYDFNTIAPAILGLSGHVTKIQAYANSTGQSFVSPVDIIKGIGISLGTLSKNPGGIILVIDSVPYDQKYHRETSINSTINQQFNEFDFSPPLTGVINKKLYFSLKYTETQNDKLAVLFTLNETDTGFTYIKEKLGGTFYENGMPEEDKEMSFSIESNSSKYPIAFQFHNIKIYENKDAFPRAFLVNKFQTVKHGDAQNFLLQNPSFDLRNNIVIDNEVPSMWTSVNSQSDKNSTVNVESYSSNKVIIQTHSKSPSLLILTDVYYPGWKAHVDGQESKIYQADGLVRTIFVPDGNHTIEFSYEPQSFMIGGIISIITAVIIVGIFIYSKKRNLV